MPDHEENCTHESDLVPEERVPNKMKVVDFVSVIYRVGELRLTVSLLVLDFDYVCPHNFPLEVDSVAEVHFTEVDEVVSALEGLYGFFHGLDVQVVLDEKVLIRALFAPVPRIELLWDGLAGQDTNVIRQNRVQHIAVVQLLSILLLLLLLLLLRCWVLGLDC